MRFWDSSAILPLLVQEATTGAIQKLFTQDPDIIVWWFTELECVSAISRLEREHNSIADVVDKALERLDTLKRSWNEVQPVQSVRDMARRLLRVHPLRFADALQLASAIISSENIPSTLALVCLDKRLIEAAMKEGFSVLPAIH